ncbi:MAG TPA: nitrous oxide-stimulated promoter family protein [Terriglobales bacterium]|nr:nitrous oxide-stimulated promoter family protein [Terriglobales bacterium]
MNTTSRRIAREKKTIAAMITIYCLGKHGGEKLCPQCNELLGYCNKRLDLCPFKEEKPTCLNCSIHCYNAQMRERIRPVMHYAGPYLLLRNPVLAIQHLADGRRKPILNPMHAK